MSARAKLAHGASSAPRLRSVTLARRVGAFVTSITIAALGCGRAYEAAPSEAPVCSSATITSATVTVTRAPESPERDPRIEKAAEHAVVPSRAGRTLAAPPVGVAPGPPLPAPVVLPAAARARVPVLRPGDSRPVMVPVETMPGIAPATPTASAP